MCFFFQKKVNLRETFGVLESSWRCSYNKFDRADGVCKSYKDTDCRRKPTTMHACSLLECLFMLTLEIPLGQLKTTSVVLRLRSHETIHEVD
jgi:hypothetical protein